MRKEKLAEEMEMMYKSLTDPEEIEKNKRKEDIKKMREEKIKDTGL